MGEEAVQEMIVLGQVLGHATAFEDTMLLKCAIQLGLADIIQAHTQHTPEGITLSQLAKSLPYDCVHVENLGRIMRYLVHMGLFAKSKDSQGPDLFKPTIASGFIIEDSKKSILPLIKPVMEEWAISPWHCLDVALDGKNKNMMITPFEKKNGCKLWEAFSQQPMIGKLFYDAMAADTMALIPEVIKVCDGVFGRIGSLVDVGGATGIAAAHIAAAFPHVKCSVLDRPDVVAHIVDCPNVECVPGDMFTSVPHADAILLKKILHDWGDEECMKILKRCREALPKEGGTLIIVESVMGHEMDGDDAWGRVKLAMDMGMMVFTGGKDRTSEEWKLLLASAGFQLHKITPILAIQYVIEAHPLP